MPKSDKYESLEPLADGTIPYSSTDHSMWERLYRRQMEVIDGRATPEYIQGMELLGFTANEIPQHNAINSKLSAITGWQVEAVPAIIPATEFFSLLSRKRFPAACFIRDEQDMDYIQEPDIFHEVFGHCPLLTNQAYADFMEQFGKMASESTAQERKILFRLFWFTIEFGLIKRPEGLRIYGGGILSSPEETLHALKAGPPKHEPFDVLNVLRTPFRIDILQPLYYVIDDFDDLYTILEKDLPSLIAKAEEMGDFSPLFPPKKKS